MSKHNINGDSDGKQKNVSAEDDVSGKKSDLFQAWLFFYFVTLFFMGSTVVFLDIITGWWGLNYLDYILILGVFGFIAWVFY